MTDSLELFNTHQQDLRNRASSFVQMIFVLAGGALSLSIAVFTGANTIALQPLQATVLSISWWGLVLSVVLLAIMLTIMILRDYFLGERWRKYLSDQTVDATGAPGVTDIIIILAGLLGVVAFIVGFVGLAYVATSVLKIA